MTVFLHIGLPKTGTTAIQNFCAAHRAALADEGYLYPRSPGPVAHTGVPMYAADFESGFPTQRNARINSPERFAKFCSNTEIQLKEEFDGSGCEHIIISSEQLYVSVKSIESMNKIKAWLSQFSDIKILVWLRRQDDLALSAFGETVRMGSPGSLRDFVSSARGKHLLDFERGISLWADAFGKESIVLRVFEPGRMQNKNPVEDFLHVIGLDALAARFPTSASAVAREGLSAEAITFLAMFNKELLAAERANKGLRALIRNAKRRENMAFVLQQVSAGSKPDLSEQTRRSIFEIYQPGNEKLFKMFGVADFNYKIKNVAAQDRVSIDTETATKYAAALWLSLFDELTLSKFDKLSR